MFFCFCGRGKGGGGERLISKTPKLTNKDYDNFFCKLSQNPVATAFEIFWMICEPILFGLTGTQIEFDELNLKEVTLTVACIAIAFVVSVKQLLRSRVKIKVSATVDRA